MRRTAGPSTASLPTPNPTIRRVHPVDHHKDPMAVQQDRLTTKQIDAPEAAIGSRKGSEPGRIRGARTIWPAALREDSAHDAFIRLDGECMRDLFGNASIVHSCVMEFHLDQRFVES